MKLFESVIQTLRFEPKKWLVTGVAGFIGSNIAEFLIREGQTVHGLDNFSTGRRENVKGLLALAKAHPAASFHFFEGDIRNRQDCDKACTGVEYVLHQAALGSVPRSIEDPLLSNENNITGFLQMLLSARDVGIKNFVYAASSSTYGDEPRLPKREELIGKPLSPYAVTKYVNELYAEVFHKTYGINCVGLRYFNIFGQRQDPQGAYAAVIPQWFAALLQDKPVYINGDGETSRDFCYIENCVQANILAACAQNKEALNTVYNVAVGERTTLKQLFAYIREEAARYNPRAASTEALYRDFRLGDVQHSLADISKAQAYLGYSPQKTLRQGLAEAASWYAQLT